MSKYWQMEHPIFPRVTIEEAAAGKKPGETDRQVWERLNRERDARIEPGLNDPLNHGWEPDVWKVADALLEWPWIDPEWAATVRGHYGVEKAVSVLLINGGYRGGKTEYAGKRAVRLMLHKQQARAWFFITSLQQSIEVQQPVIAKYLPPPYCRGRDIKTKAAYCVHSEANGFSEQRFVLHNLSRGSFRTYNQEEDNVEGAAPDMVWCDEPPDLGLIKALTGRISERNGKLLITFAPKHGFTGVVKEYVKDAKVLAQQPAFLVPRDGGAPDVEAAMRGVGPEGWEIVKAL